MPTTIVRITADEYALMQPACRPSPEELFEFQRARLAEKGLAPVDAFDHFASRLPGQGLFLLVPPPPSFLDWKDLMARVELNNKNGKADINQRRYKNLIEVPDVPTMLVDIEDGRRRLNVKPSVSWEMILAEGRVAYCVWHGYIHILMFPVVLEHHNVDVVGSHFEVGFAPIFYLDLDGRPAFLDIRDSTPHSRCGASSCGSVER